MTLQQTALAQLGNEQYEPRLGEYHIFSNNNNLNNTDIRYSTRRQTGNILPTQQTEVKTSKRNRKSWRARVKSKTNQSLIAGSKKNSNKCQG